MATFITDIGLLLTAMIGWVGDVIAMIVAEPILLLPIMLTFVGVAVGFARSLMPGK